MDNPVVASDQVNPQGPCKNVDACIAVTEQRWLQVRHIENARLTFTSVYVALATAVFAVSLATTGSRQSTIVTSLLWLFMAFVSYVGLRIARKAPDDLEAYLSDVKKLEQCVVPEIGLMALNRGPRGGDPSVGHSFELLYEGALCLWGVLLLARWLPILQSMDRMHR